MNVESEHNGEEFVETIKEYANTRYELTRLRLVQSASDAMAGMIAFFLVLVAAMFFLFFISYATAIYLCTITESAYAGYFIVGGFYMLVALVLLIIKEKSIHIPFENRFIRQFLK